MDLKTALGHVWDDVADSVYQGPTLAESVRYARAEISADELALVGEPTGDRSADELAHLVTAYELVRAATDDEIWSASAELV